MNSSEDCCEHCGKPLASGLKHQNCGAPCESTPLIFKIISFFSFLVLVVTGGFVIHDGHYGTYTKYTHALLIGNDDRTARIAFEQDRSALAFHKIARADLPPG